MNIQFEDFDLRHEIIAPVIYGTSPHHVTGRGVVVSRNVRTELQALLAAFSRANGAERLPYYRVDAYFDENTLWVLEINAAFVDGWGTALNLSRASGVSIVEWTKLQFFPRSFATTDPRYLPELQLMVDELKSMGMCGHRIVPWSFDQTESTYVYGRAGTKEAPNTVPYDGLRLDDKLNLGLFSRSWSGRCVKIPTHYFEPADTWDEIPTNAILKFCDKGSDESRRARASVFIGKPSGKASFLKGCYREKKMLAQSRVEPSQDGGMNCQLVILAIGDTPITGYVQYSDKEIINDDSVHGPLVI